MFSLAVGMMFGTAGLPHILMRFFTVKDARTARSSVLYASGLMGYFYDAHAIERISHHPDFPKLVKRKQRLIWSLTLIILLTYYGLVGLMAFAPDVLGRALIGSSLNLGMILAASMIVLSFVLTAWYVYVNNQKLDRLLDTIQRECGP